MLVVKGSDLCVSSVYYPSESGDSRGRRHYLFGLSLYHEHDLSGKKIFHNL